MLSTPNLSRCHNDPYLDLVDNVEGIVVPSVSEVDADKGIHNVIAIVCNAIKGIPEIGSGVFHPRAAP